MRVPMRPWNRKLTIAWFVGAIVTLAQVSQTQIPVLGGGLPFHVQLAPISLSGAPLGGVSQLFGQSTTFVGDIDGDGRDDLAVGEPQCYVGGTRAGRITIFSGASGSVLRIHYGASGTDERIGLQVSNLGDLDGDGVSDYGFIRSSSPFAVPPLIGGVEVISGLTGVQLYGFSDPDVVSGEDLIDVGDIDADGVPDFAYSVPGSYPLNAPPPLGIATGRVEFHSGASGTLLYQVFGSSAQQGFGDRVVVPGDLDGDGTNDLLVYTGVAAGQPLQTRNVIALRLTSAAAIPLFQVAEGTPTVGTNQFELLTARPGDIDLDGVPDFATKSQLVPSPLSATLLISGPIELRSGSNGQVIGQVPNPIANVIAYDNGWGLNLIELGDVDADGTSDLVAPMVYQFLSAATGMYYVPISLVLSGRDRGVLFQLNGLSIQNAGVGDADGDGFADLVDWNPNANQNGIVRIFRGSIAMAPNAAAGSVNAGGPGGTVDALFGRLAPVPTFSAGGLGRTLISAVGNPVEFAVCRPPSHVAPSANYIVFGRVGATPTLQEFNLPFSLGSMCLTPSFLDPSDPSLFCLASTFGLPGVIPGFPATTMSPTAPSLFLPPIPFPMTFLLQGMIEDSSAAVVPLSVTNAIRIVVQ